MSAAIQIKVIEALEKIGKSNGTKLPDVDAPAEFEGNNHAIDLFHQDRAAVFELQISQQIAAYADKRVTNAKKNVNASFANEIFKIKPGTSNTIIRGNVALNVEVRNPPARLDRALLISAMIKRGISTQDAESIIEEGSAKTKPPTYFKPSIIA